MRRKFLTPAALVVLASALVASTPVLAAESYKVDPVHSTIAFRVEHLGVSYAWGRFNAIDGKAVIDEENPAASSVTLEVRIDSIDTNSEKRDKHLMSPDFFDAKTFPVARFTSTKVTRKGDTWQVTGTLELHGVKKTLTIPFERVGSGKDPWGGFRTGFSGRTTIKRSEFNISWGLNGAVGDEVELFLDFELIRE
ncbi:MAG: YceI family protein [Acidobacteriota bacterium]|nr:MAG: hypothetical protein D6738_11520 [Acidobacteriota bacterium]